MLQDGCIPEIVAHFDDPSYTEAIQNILWKVIPEEELGKPWSALLPRTYTLKAEGIPCSFSIYVLSKQNAHAFKFFFELITRWLIPGKSLHVSSVFSSDFHLRGIEGELYTVSE